jgi:hypothetical protein
MTRYREAVLCAEPEVGDGDVLTEGTLHRATAEAGARDPFAVDVKGDSVQGLFGYDGVAAAPGDAVLQLRGRRDRVGSGVAHLKAHPERLEL